MKKGNFGPGSLFISLAALLFICSSAFADDTSQFNGHMVFIQNHRTKIESRLGIVVSPQNRTLYNKAVLGHWEQSQQEERNVMAQNVPFDKHLNFIRAHRTKVELQLGIDPNFDIYPEPTSYFDDKEAHYEQVMIMSDFIDQGIR